MFTLFLEYIALILPLKKCLLEILGEVLDWLKLLLAEDLTAEDLKRDGASALPKLHGALLKNEQDVHLFERLAFMARSQR